MDDPRNYRPITLLSTIDKVMESGVSDALRHYLKFNVFLAVQQHGFWFNCSCLSNLVEDMNGWMLTNDDQQKVDIVFLDYAKSFDTVNHPRLTAKLWRYGIIGSLLIEPSIYLTNSWFRVRVNWEYSSRVAISSGIPQHSILGTILFRVLIKWSVERPSLPLKPVRRRCYGLESGHVSMIPQALPCYRKTDTG